MDKIQWTHNKHKLNRDIAGFLGGKDTIEKVYDFHQTLPGYMPTNLYSLDNLAKFLGVGAVFVKDESTRFGLNAFKGLGSSYAVGHLMKANPHSQMTFTTATAGNHGIGLAWSAQIFGQNAVIYMPKGTAQSKLERFAQFGAKAQITDMIYDDTVRYVNRLAQDKGWIVVQDTSWAGYTEIPKLIIQGYMTIVAELAEQIKQRQPSHVILQVGVGSFASAIAEGIKEIIGTPFKLILVEPSEADCFYQSALGSDGEPKYSSGSLNTIMAGLGCKEVNPMAWNILKQHADYFVSCPENIAAKGMRMLGNPIQGDQRLISGESGAVPMGFLAELCKNPNLASLKQALGVNSDSKFLFISTEGDTNPKNYRDICWDGKLMC